MAFLITIFSTLLICCSGLVVLSTNPIYSVLFLILAFVNAAALTLIAGHDYIAVLFVVLYVGAMCTFFLFALMILDIKPEKDTKSTLMPTFLFLVISVVGFVICSNTSSMLNGQLIPGDQWLLENDLESYNSSYIELSQLMDSTTQIYNLGSIIYTTFALELIGASLILLSAMLGSIALTLNRSYRAKTQLVYEQNIRDLRESVVKYGDLESKSESNQMN